jgi:hypothetical protein
MPETIERLETRRTALLDRLAQTGDMRRGSITEVFRPCGKPTCCCAGADHPGHGPYYAFTTKVGGKTRTVQLRRGARLEKLEREVETYRQFRATSEEVVQVNEALCDLRPVPAQREPAVRVGLKKKSPRSSKPKSHGK